MDIALIYQPSALQVKQFNSNGILTYFNLVGTKCWNGGFGPTAGVVCCDGLTCFNGNDLGQDQDGYCLKTTDGKTCLPGKIIYFKWNFKMNIQTEQNAGLVVSAQLEPAAMD